MTIIKELKKFALRGNLVDMAVGFTVGAAFTTIAKSLVDDIIMPPVGLILGSSDFSDLFVVLQAGETNAGPYKTLAAASEAGAVTLNVGLFLNNVLTFLLITIVMFALVRFMNKLDEELDERFGEKVEPGEPTEKKCDFCRTVIPIQASRCPACTSQLELEAEEAA